MGATEEQIQILSDAHITHVSYILILYSIAFILFLCTIFSPLFPHQHTASDYLPVVNILLHIYAVHAWPESTRKTPHQRIDSVDTNDDSSATYAPAPRRRAEAEHIHDAEAFELQGLITDEEDEGDDVVGRGAKTKGRTGSRRGDIGEGSSNASTDETLLNKADE